jgi:hypothetical protein
MITLRSQFDRTRAIMHVMARAIDPEYLPDSHPAFSKSTADPLLYSAVLFAERWSIVARLHLGWQQGEVIGECDAEPDVRWVATLRDPTVHRIDDADLGRPALVLCAGEAVAA